MSNIIKKKHIFFRILAIVLMLFLYTILRVNKMNISALQQKDLYYQREVKNKESYISDLQNELKMSSTKGYIEKQARMDGFIMPDDIHFVYNLNIHKEDNDNN